MAAPDCGCQLQLSRPLSAPYCFCFTTFCASQNSLPSASTDTSDSSPCHSTLSLLLPFPLPAPPHPAPHCSAGAVARHVALWWRLRRGQLHLQARRRGRARGAHRPVPGARAPPGTSACCSNSNTSPPHLTPPSLPACPRVRVPTCPRVRVSVFAGPPPQGQGHRLLLGRVRVRPRQAPRGDAPVPGQEPRAGSAPGELGGAQEPAGLRRTADPLGDGRVHGPDGAPRGMRATGMSALRCKRSARAPKRPSGQRAVSETENRAREQTALLSVSHRYRRPPPVSPSSPRLR